MAEASKVEPSQQEASLPLQPEKKGWGFLKFFKKDKKTAPPPTPRTPQSFNNSSTVNETSQPIPEIDSTTETDEEASPEPYIGEKKLARITQHLASIDQTLVPYARTIALPPYKDLTDQEVLSSELKPQDLVAVHLTNTFPENGVIHPMVHYRPEIFRFTTHFTINGVAERIPFWGYNWEDRKYAVFVPLDKITGRVLQFHPNETYVLEDLVLPEGTIILKNVHDQTQINPGKAKVVEADFSKAGDRLNGFHRAVFEQIIKQGYFSSRVAPHGWRNMVNDSEQARILEKFCQKNGMEFSSQLHANHWTGMLENYSIWLTKAKEEKDESLFQEMIEQAKDTFEREATYPESQKTPVKYRKILFDFIRQFHQQYFPEAELPELPEINEVDQSAERAKVKIVDLLKDSEDFLHFPNPAMLPLVIVEGLASHEYAHKKFGRSIKGLWTPDMQAKIADAGKRGWDLISVFDPKKVSSSVLDILKQYGKHMTICLLISSGKIRNAPKYPYEQSDYTVETLLRSKVPLRDISGIISQDSFRHQPLATFEDGIFRKHPSSKNIYEQEYDIVLAKESFLKYPAKNPQIEQLRLQLAATRDIALNLLLDLARFFGWETTAAKSFDKMSAEERYNLGKFIPSDLNPLEEDYSSSFRENGWMPVYLSEKRGSRFDIEKFRQELLARYPTGQVPIANIKNEYAIPAVSTDENRSMPIEEFVAIVGQFDKSLKEYRQLTEEFGPKYFEALTGKPLEEATVEDYLIGLCRENEIPLYDMDSGKVIWPEISH